ncbi:MAG: VOC family protein [Janthinobacterium lividum]
MLHIIPYLNFNGNCREAMTFYQHCLGGELTLQTGADSPLAEHLPPDMHHGILHAALQVGDATLFGSDMLGAQLIAGNAVTLAPQCRSEEELRRVFAALAEGGQVLRHPQPDFWGGIVGVLTDKYGQPWMLVYSENPS